MTANEWRECQPLELRADGDTLTLEGYAAIFNSMSEDLGGFREIIRPGAFRDSIAAGADVRLLINHDGMPLARTKSGTLRLAEDHRGLHIAATLDRSDPDVQRLAPKIKRGDMSQMSFGFVTKRDQWRKEGDQDIRELHQVDLFDVSPVTYPAYKATEMAIRSLNDLRSTQQKPSGHSVETCRYWLELEKCT